jgi:hypothetical protein
VLICSLGWLSDALAWGTASNITYDLPNETLSGYAQTWRDPTDFDYYDCLYWAWNDTYYTYECDSYQIQLNYAYADAAVADPDGSPYAETSLIDYSNAVASYSLPVTTADFGVWTMRGQHYVISDIFIQSCYFFFCIPPVYIDEYWFTAGETSASGRVCVTTVDTMDNSVIGAINANYWPIEEPWERGVGGYCGSYAPDVVIFAYWNDSFARFYPDGVHQDDPCKSSMGQERFDRILGAHAHPWFHNLAEFQAGHGCFGDQTYHPQSYIDDTNARNRGFSDNDNAAFTASGGKTMYLRLPKATTIIRKFKRNQAPNVVLP